MQKIASQRLLLVIIILLIYTSLTLLKSPIDYYYIPISHYRYLTEGFLSGHLHLSIVPSTKLLKLTNPYDPIANAAYTIFDASLYKGKYYLYFGPLPVVAFFMPIKLLTGLDATEGLGILYFLSLGFIVNFLLLTKIKDAYFSFVTETQLLFSGLVLGLSGTALCLMNTPLIYEVAISSASCFMSFAIFFLYQFFHNYFKVKYLCLFSFCLSMTVAGRPDFAAVCFFLVPAMCIYFYLYLPKNRLKILLPALLVPVTCIGLILSAYNYLRFGSILEFGQNYMVSIIDPTQVKLYMKDHLLQKMASNLFYYLLQPYHVHAVLPEMKNYFLQPTAGILLTAPFAILFFALPSLLKCYFKRGDDEIRPLLWFLSFIYFIPILILAFLIPMSGAAQRYEMDFSPYLFILAIISLWLMQKKRLDSHWIKLTNLFFIATGTIGIFFGIWMGAALY